MRAPAATPAASRIGQSGRTLEAGDDLAREALELVEVVVAGRQHHVLNAGRFEIADSLAVPIPVPVSAHLTGAVTRLLVFPEGTWAEIEIDDAPILYREFRVPVPLNN